MDQNLAGLSYAACGLLIVVYAWARFNTPPSNRSSTRQALYWWAGLGYVLSALVLFAALSLLLKAAIWRSVLLGANDDPSLPAPLIATLAMTTLLPSVPLLKPLDEWFLSLFLGWAEIPAEAKRRAAAMTPHSFSVSELDVAGLRETFGDGSCGDDLVRHLTSRRDEGLPMSQYRLTRVAKLFDRLGRLAAERRYAQFFAAADADFAALSRQTVEFLRRSAASLTIAERLRGHEEEAAYEELMQERRITFAERCRDIFTAQARFLAHAVLRSEKSEKDIVCRLREIGFAATEPMNVPHFPIDSLTLLAGGMLVYLAVVTILFAPITGEPSQQAAGLIMALKIWLVRLVPVCTTVWLIQRYAFFRRSTGDSPRFFAYVVNGGVASAIAALICLLFYQIGADGNADLTMVAESRPVADLAELSVMCGGGAMLRRLAQRYAAASRAAPGRGARLRRPDGCGDGSALLRGNAAAPAGCANGLAAAGRAGAAKRCRHGSRRLRAAHLPLCPPCRQRAARRGERNFHVLPVARNQQRIIGPRTGVTGSRDGLPHPREYPGDLLIGLAGGAAVGDCGPVRPVPPRSLSRPGGGRRAGPAAPRSRPRSCRRRRPRRGGRFPGSRSARSR